MGDYERTASERRGSKRLYTAKENNIDIIDIKLSSSCSIYSEEQIYCFTALIMYTEIKEE